MLNLIVAPKKHVANGEKFVKKIVKYLKTEKVEYSVYFSQTLDDIKDNVSELFNNGETEFVVVGDDVIVNAVISGIKDLGKVKIGIVPTGKKDDFASYLNLSANPIQAIKDILLKNVEKIDLLDVNGNTVINNIVVGASVEAFHMFSQYRIKNIIAEKYAIKKYGNTFAGIELTFEDKNKPVKENIFELVIANGGFSLTKPVSPLSNMQDGLFNMNYTVVHSGSENKKYIKKFNKGNHVYDDETKQSWLTHVKISSPDKKIKALVDGKICNFEEIEVSILENALKLYKRP